MEARWYFVHWALLILSMACFLISFFPSEERVVDEGSGETRVSDFCGRDCQELLAKNPPTVLYSRVVLIIIDAMRADFAKEMGHFQERIQRGDGVAYVCNAAAPTVTLPRIKSLMSGQTAQFSDFLFNFNPVSTHSDNLLFSLHRFFSFLLIPRLNIFF